MEELLVSLTIFLFSTQYGWAAIATVSLALIVVTYIGYIKIMRLKRIRDSEGKDLKWYHKFYGYPLLAVGVVLDTLLNVIVGTIIFREFPRELLLTPRLDRWAREDKDGYRGKFARFVCRYMLNPFDPGHCYCGKEKD